MAPSPPNSDVSKDKKTQEDHESHSSPNNVAVRRKRNEPKENENEDGEYQISLNERKVGSNVIAQPTDANQVSSSSQTKRNQEIRRNKLVRLNVKFQHYCFCDDIKCTDCPKVEKGVIHPRLPGCIKNTCIVCWWVRKTLEFHQARCTINCSLCAGKIEKPLADPIYSRAFYADVAVESDKITDGITKMGRGLVGQNFKEEVHYKIEEKLGEGGNAQVFKAKLLTDEMKKQFRGDVLAVKLATVKPSEIRILQTISFRPDLFVPHHFIVNKKESVPWKEKTRQLEHRIFLEKCDKSLSCYRKSKPGRVLSLEEAKFYWIQILRGVVVLHSFIPPIIHKDIKADNVLLAGLVARLSDFEYAVQGSQTQNPHPCGTPFFIAPEVKNRQCYGTPADMYSMGASFLELTNQLRLTNDKVKMVTALKVKDVKFGSLIESCLRENPILRPTASEALEHDAVKTFLLTHNVPLPSMASSDTSETL